MGGKEKNATYLANGCGAPPSSGPALATVHLPSCLPFEVANVGGRGAADSGLQQSLEVAGSPRPCKDPVLDEDPALDLSAVFSTPLTG